MRLMRGKELAPPVLLAAYPILALYAHNFIEVRPPDVLLPLGANVGIALLLFAALTLLLRNATRAALLVATLFLWIFAYAGVLHGLRQLLDAIGIVYWIPNRLFLAIWGIALAVAVVAILRARKRLESSARTFLIAGIVLVSLASIQIASAALGNRAVPDTDSSSTAPRVPRDESVPTLVPPNPAPDVYYLVFDRYAGNVGLREFFDYDNSEMLAFLRASEFVVPDSAIANYPMTNISLASSLNMDYLGPNFLGPVPYAGMLDRHRVGQAFKKAGYRYYHLGSWYEFTGRSSLADENARFARYPSEFVAILAQTTVFNPFLPKDDIAQQVLYSFDHLTKLIRAPGPKFVFCHVISPHPPYIFQADGSPLSQEMAASRTEKENYIGQLQHVNRRLRDLVDAILAQSSTPPIIVIQADEGPLVFAEEEGLSEPEVWQRRASIMAAYHLPGDGADPSPDMTPVNTFRFLFNRYFGTSLPLLENRLLFWPEVGHNGKPADPKRQFPFIDITDRYRAAVRDAEEREQ